MARDLEDNPPPPSFQELFERYYESVVHWFLMQGVGREESQDLAQDVFLSAHKGLPKFRGDSRINTWLFQIVRNIYKNYLRKRKTLKRSGEEISLASGGLEGEEGSSPEIDPESPIPSPEKTLLNGERNSALSVAVDTLPPKMRQTVELRLQGLKYREVAEVMGLSIESVKSHLHKARSYLRAEIAESEARDAGAEPGETNNG